MSFMRYGLSAAVVLSACLAARADIGLAQMNNDFCQESVKAHLKTLKDDSIFKPIEKVVRVEKVKTCAGIKFAPDEAAGGKISWEYAPRMEKLSPEEAALVEKTLKDLLQKALETEKDPTRKLNAEAMKKLPAIIKAAQISAGPYSKLEDFTTDDLRKWVKTYLEKNPKVFDSLASSVNVGDLKELKRLSYTGGNKPKITWEYLTILGATLKDDDKAKVADALKKVLNDTYDGAAKDAKYPAGDAAKFKEYVANGTYRVTTPAGGLVRKDVTEKTVRDALRTYLDNPENGTLAGKLEGLGVAANRTSDKDALVAGVKYTREADGTPTQFEWTWRPTAGKKTFDQAELVQIYTALRNVLGNAISTGGGKEELRLSGNEFNDYFKATISEAKFTKYEKPFGLDDLTTTVLKERVTNFLPTNASDLEPLTGKVDVTYVKQAFALEYVKGPNFTWEVATLPTRDKDLTADEKKAVEDTLRQIIYRALTFGDDPTRKFSDDDVKVLAQAANKATIKITDLKVSKETQKDREERLRRELADAENRRRVVAVEERLERLESEIAELKKTVADSSGGKYSVQYEEYCCGVHGCRRGYRPILVRCR